MTENEKVGVIEKKIRKVMSTDRFVMIMNILRILMFLIIATIIFYLVKEIEHVKMLGNACDICMEKTGASCYKITNISE